MNITAKQSIDLNADIGELTDKGARARDASLLGIVSSANIACGAHAGSAEILRETMARALEHGVNIGAHPGFPDREYFGRRTRGNAYRLNDNALETSLRTQLTLARDCAKALGASLDHVKLHGALYHEADHNTATAQLSAQIISDLFPSIMVLCAPVGFFADIAASRGLRPKFEGFADRAYLANGTLKPRQDADAVLTDQEYCAAQALKLATKPDSVAPDLHRIDSICVHGDSSAALRTARAIQARLAQDDIAIAPLS